MRRLLATLCVAGMVLVPGVLSAQVDVGGQLDWGGDTDLGIGGRVNLGLPLQSFPMEAIGSFDVFFPSGPANYWEINLNTVYLIPVKIETVKPYAGAGLSFAHVSGPDVVTPLGTFSASDSNLGLNFLGGAKFPMHGFTPFGEIRLETQYNAQLVITGGVTVNVGPGFSH